MKVKHKLVHFTDIYNIGAYLGLPAAWEWNLPRAGWVLWLGTVHFIQEGLQGGTQARGRRDLVARQQLGKNVDILWLQSYKIHSSTQQSFFSLQYIMILYIKGNMSDSFTNYNYVGNTKVSVSINRYTYFCVSYIIVISERIRHIPFNIIIISIT